MSEPTDTAAPAPTPPSPPALPARPRFVLMHPLMALAQAVFILATMYVYLHGWRRDFTIPFGFWVDSLFYLMQAKSTVDNGWWWFNPMVGAPIGLDARAFPANGNVDQLLVLLVSRFVHDPIGAVNMTWLVMVAISGVAATWCLRTLGLSRPSSFVAGTLFALTPYAIYKNIGHFGMAIYLVPFICSVAMQLASGRLPERGYLKGPGLGLLIGSGLIGFNYIYYPFFGAFFLVVATAIGFLTFREARILRAGVLALAVVAGCTTLNLVPSLVSWSQHGKPVIFIDKVPSQAEIYGLKIRTLVSPPFQHWFPVFRKWIEKEQMSNYPLETENMTSRLGFVATLGFLGLIGVMFAPSVAARTPTGRLCLGASQLTIGGLLLATIGGFGALFNLLVSPDIRAYSRICPFLAMFALAGVAVALDWGRWSGRWKGLLAAAVLALGVADQMGAAAGINGDYPGYVAELPGLKSFVQRLEEQLPDQSMVLQLPFRRTFLNETGAVRMKPYEHLKLYLVSHHLRWTYPALTNDQSGWQESAARLSMSQLPLQMAAEGFAAIVVDRNGYQDNGQEMAAAIRKALGKDAVLSESDRFIAFDIRSLKGQASLPPLPTRPDAMTRNLAPCPGQTIMFLETVGRARLPFPHGVAAVSGSRPIKITGWGVDRPGGASGAGVDFVVDGTPYPTFYGLDRVDVSDYLGNVGFRHAGFAAELPRRALPPGEHTLAIRVVAVSGQCYYEGAGVKLVIR